MSIDHREERLESRIADLYATDAEFAAAAPSAEVVEATGRPGLRLAQIVRTVVEGYAERPALGQRAVGFVTDSETGRTSAELLPRFDTVTYAQVWDRAGALASALADTVQLGDRVCVLGFTGVDFTVIDIALIRLAAVAVPLQTSAAADRLAPIVAETEPRVIAAGVEYLADAVDLALSNPAPQRLVVFDYHPEVDDHREAVEAARSRLTAAGRPVTVDVLGNLLDRGASLPAPPDVAAGDDRLALLLYTSGSTGAPKGAMYTESLATNLWRSAPFSGRAATPSITLNFMPMSHGMGRVVLFATLSRGGTGYFVARSDLSTLLDDLALVRPTQLFLVPRVWDMVRERCRSEIEQRPAGGDPAEIESEVMADLRRNLLGGRFLSAMTGSAPISEETKAFLESLLDMPLVDGYGSTEAGGVFVDGRMQRPPVIDYRLADVPELGYYRTDRPYPRGELLVKTLSLFAGYYKRPEVTAEVFDEDGYYRTGDIVAETGPDQVTYLDRRNNVLKLAQGEFVTVAAVEAALEASALVRQIYVYGNSAHPYLLAVIVPTPEALSRGPVDEVKRLIAGSLQQVAKEAGLQSYEIPRDFILETTPFTLENGLLTGLRKLARPVLKQQYGPRLEQLYADLVQGQADELRTLRRDGRERPVLETVARAAQALLGTSGAAPEPDAHFTDMGGDSLSALTFGNLLSEIFDVEVPVGIIVSPATDLAALADHISARLEPSSARLTFAGVHDADGQRVHARELTLDAFLDLATLSAPELAAPITEVRTVLLTGATGFLGRFLALEWLRRLAPVDGTLICLVRAKDDAAARERLDRTFDSGDPELLTHYRGLAAGHLEVIAGDKSEPRLGLDPQAWQRLADTVDLIVDPAAMVNHVLPYSQLFGPNTVGTAELIRLAVTTRLKPYSYVSTVGVGDQVAPGAFTEDADIRAISATRTLEDSYAGGYATSKWAGEVLLREAHDLFGLPVAVFRCDMIMADTRFRGQLNVPDMFTRMMLSLAATGIAPTSFYELDEHGRRRRAHYDGLPVDFIAEAIAALGGREKGFETFHVMNPHDDGIGLDEYVDWLIDAGYAITRVGDYDEWLPRFETAMRALPERQGRNSLLPLLHNYQRPAEPIRGSMAPADRFRAAVREAKIGPGEDIPHITVPIIVKYVTSLQLLGLL
ncbi:carboxylic acid reductase [Nocardia alni]|uniref:carboxylic acid reductase n=1 Tax=Nocardia alni TaxID=2815723 RepID=UPI001C21A897|nr:carboxylic acid reductase [Nocardia alni]